MSAESERNWVVLGQIGKVHGVRGWLKLNSFTAPAENILKYSQLTSEIDGHHQVLEIDQYKLQANGLIIHIKGFDDSDQAVKLTGSQLKIVASELPDLEDGDYYWHQLEGLEVENKSGQLLGVVDRLLETGANDVLVIKPIENSIDNRERLIPYIKEAVICSIDLQANKMLVNWEADYLE